MKRHSPWMPWVIEGGIALVAFGAVAASKGLFTAQDSRQILYILCDAFFVPGIFLFCFGVLAFCAYGGVFDMLAYGAHSLLVLFTPFRKPEKHQKYYEYKLMKDARRQKPKPRTLILGACFLLLATVCLVMGDRIGRQIV